MKKALFISLIFVFAIGMISFNTIDKNQGIQFFKGTLKQAQQKAIQEKKPIFIDVYATWCGPCKKLKRSTFKNEEVGTYFNANFINIAINGETQEGIQVVNKYKVTGYPTLLIIDAKGNLLTKNIGFIEPHILVNFGKRIVP